MVFYSQMLFNWFFFFILYPIRFYFIPKNQNKNTQVSVYWGNESSTKYHYSPSIPAYKRIITVYVFMYSNILKELNDLYPWSIRIAKNIYFISSVTNIKLCINRKKKKQLYLIIRITILPTPTSGQLFHLS